MLQRTVKTVVLEVGVILNENWSNDLKSVALIRQNHTPQHLCKETQQSRDMRINNDVTTHRE